ncbi:MAG: hypothetical protein SGJ09_07560 [Phycisphaerae bacterium]|nr:hypothetical protein [Phycisphaerae bacterium]
MYERDVGSPALVRPLRDAFPVLDAQPLAAPALAQGPVSSRRVKGLAKTSIRGRLPLHCAQTAQGTLHKLEEACAPDHEPKSDFGAERHERGRCGECPDERSNFVSAGGERERRVLGDTGVAQSDAVVAGAVCGADEGGVKAEVAVRTTPAISAIVQPALFA